ncbi:RNA polymerase sigma-70 factor, ECF subfamily [Tenacibaculum sp. MAR_2009_124]|uniref:RNA polymerase sigma factor n=1 Tax=Tenacibaculum sp. MAR_2009_124 TaxID=1250059 RepID=UPI00089CC322|nr:RNA polymerase sigma factor [Tenacibaculum sp. MAR_2009_124]SEC16961.1 RNA polymerase sigma-70 factor, ECF subfamily [Tenacibaculum sp. MAR_2009_124]
MKNLTDEELMIQVTNGDLNKLSIIFDRYHVHLYNFFNKMIQDKTISEDLTQEVFIKVLKYRTSYKNGNFTSWIFTIARNIFSTYYQKRKKERTHLINDDICSNDKEISEGNEEAIDHLQKALLQLTVSDRELIVMHRLQEINYEQIAEITGNSIGALKVKMHRALKKLKSIYFQNIEN